MVSAEDFTFNNVQEYTAMLLNRLLKLLEACGVLLSSEGSFVKRLLKGRGDLPLWHEDEQEISSD